MKNNVIDFNAFKARRALTEDGRVPLFVSHLSGKVTGRSSQADHLGDRLARIGQALDRINTLMMSLKKQSKDERK